MNIECVVETSGADELSVINVIRARDVMPGHDGRLSASNYVSKRPDINFNNTICHNLRLHQNCWSVILRFLTVVRHGTNEMRLFATDTKILQFNQNERCLLQICCKTFNSFNAVTNTHIFTNKIIQFIFFFKSKTENFAHTHIYKQRIIIECSQSNLFTNRRRFYAHSGSLNHKQELIANENCHPSVKLQFKRSRCL